MSRSIERVSSKNTLATRWSLSKIKSLITSHALFIYTKTRQATRFRPAPAMSPPLPPRRSSSKGRGRGGRGPDRRLLVSSDKAKKHERSSSSNGHKRSGRGGPFPTAPIASSVSSVAPYTRPTRAVTTVLKKIVVRNIPSTATEPEVQQFLRAHDVDLEFVWLFVPGRTRSNNRASTPGRLYLDMKKEPEKAAKIIAALHGQTFERDVKEKDVDAKSLDVEFAPFQRIAREKQRSDAKNGTIGRDPDYVAFLEELSRPKDKLPSAEAVVDMAEGETVEKPVAALVKYLNERKVHSRDKGKVIRKKSTEDKLKPLKDRQKKSSGDAASAQDSKNRKQRGKASPKKGPAKQEPLTAEPGMLRIMAPKSGTATGDPASTPATMASGRAPSTNAPAEHGTEKRAPRSGKKNGGRGRSNLKKSTDGTSAAAGEGTNRKPHSRLKAKVGGKKEPSNKGERCAIVLEEESVCTEGFDYARHTY
uniref:UPF3 domain-containing protein n=1 Tax=Hyaloperonospora arabidopsidis (strain Emoy2) TaxID=559515 RepID=M4BWK3_HYAAE